MSGANTPDPAAAPDRYVAASPTTVSWGWIPSIAAEPVATVPDGSVVTVDTVSHEGLLGDQGRDPVAFFAGYGVPADEVLADGRDIAASSLDHDQSRDGPHVVVGPIRVAGARRGDVLAVEMLALDLRAWYGIISNRHGRGALAGELPRAGDSGAVPAVVSTFATADAATATGRIDLGEHGHLELPLRPHLGLVGTADEEPRHSTAPSAVGGNIDVAELGAGTRLLLPVQGDGAGLCVGDPHYAQGDGEVALTALEAPLRATLRLSVLTAERARRLRAFVSPPLGETPTHWILPGLGETLDEAMTAACRRAVAFLVDAGVPEPRAIAYLSAAGDFAVTQVVNGVKGVHCRLRKRDLAHLGGLP